MKRILIACLTLATTPVFAYTENRDHHWTEQREVHDSWEMACFPTNNDPFRIVSSWSERTLIIFGRNGVRRYNTVVSSMDTNNGFIIEADGFDYRGRPRHIKVHFSDNGTSYLDVTDRNDPAIHCGNAVANSDD